MWRLVLLLVLLVTLSCNCSVATTQTLKPADPFYGWYFTVDLTEFDPPPTIYREWFDEVKACTGLPEGEFSDVNWYLVRFMRNMWNLKTPVGTHVNSSITLVINFLDNEALVKHEVVHFIHWANGVNDPGVHVGGHFQLCVPTELLP
jgi:hypothetical protein